MASSLASDEPEKRITPLRFGVRYRPPSLALEYRADSTGLVELKEIALEWVRDDSKADDVYDELVKAHDLYLGAHTVSVSQVKRLIQMLIANLKFWATMPTCRHT